MKMKHTPGGLVLRAFHFLLTSISVLVSHSLNYLGFLYVLPGFHTIGSLTKKLIYN